MNTQTERLPDHTARFTVELDNDRLEQAKQTAARNLAKRINIPGFRKGKVPYRILVNYIGGEAALLEDAVEILGNEIYREALEQSNIEPYGPGQIEDFKVEPQPTFTFVVPLQPEVTLNDYRSVRVDFVVPAVEDEDVNRSMKLLQEQQAVVEESHRPVEVGNRVPMDIHGTALPEAEAAETPAKAAGESEGEEAHPEHDHDHDDDTIIHQHDSVMVLDAEHEEPVPGFRDALVGANVGDVREFELAYPDNKDEYQDLAGRRGEFHVTIKKVETITLPALNDDLA
ncbi:MAG TPA: trigger factor, partial [Phototrophicaceae bacterium]|nr:trigger factor [Phototrophicaceae bacterium]